MWLIWLHQPGRPLPFRSPRSSVVSPDLPGTTGSAGSLLIVRTGTSLPFWPGSNASMRARRSRRKRSCLRTSRQWWRPFPTISAGSETGRSCSWAMQVACAVRRWSASMCTRTIHRTPAAGSRSLTAAPCSPSMPRPAGARSRSGVAQATRPAPSTLWSNGYTLPRSTMARSSCAPHGTANVPSRPASPISTSPG